MHLYSHHSYFHLPLFHITNNTNYFDFFFHLILKLQKQARNSNISSPGIRFKKIRLDKLLKGLVSMYRDSELLSWISNLPKVF